MALTKVSYGVITADASSADLNIDANTLFVDSSANKVGVGTTSPSQKLSVSSGDNNDARIQVLTGDSNAGAYFQARSGSDGYYGLELFAQSTEKWFIGGYGANRLGFWCGAKTTASNEKMSVTTDGRVGIGTTTPGYTLDVNSGTVDWPIRALSSDDKAGIIIADNDTVTYLMSQDSKFSVGSTASLATTNLTLKSNGFLGLGTTNPLDLIHIKSDSTDARMLIDGHTDADAELKFAEAGTVKYSVGYDAGIDSFIIGTTNVDTNRRLVIDSAGSVGIGTQDPQYKLDVSGTSDITMRIHRPSSGLAATDTCGIGFSQRGDTNVSSSDTRAGIFSSYNGDLFLAVEAGGNLNSNPMDHSALFIEGANGRVGIGTTSPSESLEVNLGDMKVQGGANASTRGLIIAHTGQTGNLTMLRQDSTSSRGILETTERNLRISAGSAGGTGTSETLDFFVNGAERMMIDTSGKVGIGTGSPTNNLHIACDAGDEGILVKSTGDTSNTFVFDANRGNAGAVLGNFVGKWNGTAVCDIRYHAGGDTTNKDNGQIKFYTAEAGTTAERMVIDDEGNVGIATSAPTAKLHSHANGTNVLAAKFTGLGGNVIKFAPYISNGAFSSLSHVNDVAILAESAGGIVIAHSASGDKGIRIDDTGGLEVGGALSKGSGSFKIDHPLESKKDTHHLVHSFIEGPQADLIYRGTINLVNGTATVDLDAKFTMTNGTFTALNRNVQVFTTNESDWDNVKGSVVGNTLTITCQNSSSNATVSWLVVGERQDQHMKDTPWTNADGKVIVEPLKRVVEEE